MNKQKQKRFVKKATAFLERSGYMKPKQMNAKYQNLFDLAIQSLDQVEILSRHVHDMGDQADVYHTATFRELSSATNFKNFLHHMEYTMEYHRVFIDKHEIKFRKSTCISNAEMIRQTVCFANVVDELNGRYDGWNVDFDLDTRRYVAVSAPQKRPVVGISWHWYEKTFERYLPSFSYLHEPQKSYQYMDDVSNERFFSVLQPEDVDQLMAKLRNKEGCMDIFKLPHFDDSYVNELTEILQKEYYTTEFYSDGFTDLAYASDRLGNRKVAMQLALHAMSIGEIFEEMSDDLDEENDTDLGVDVKRKVRFQALNEQLKPARNRSDARKHKI